MSRPLAVIGAGPAGVAAAVQLRRAGVAFRLLEKDNVGGLLNEAQRVENFPGVPGGVAGRVLAARLHRQLRALGIAVENERVVRLSGGPGRFRVQTEGESFLAARVILSCGTRPLSPGPPLETLRLNHRVHDSVLPLLRVRNETIAIVGGGDAAFDYALSLAGCNQVHILMRAAEARALPLLAERCRRHPRIKIHAGFRLAKAEFLDDGEWIILKAGRGRGEIRCQWVLTAVGRVPTLDFLDPALRSSLSSLVKNKWILMAGDTVNGRCRQAAIAAGDGLRAAMEILHEVGR
jgi:thioredoxin reductase (NADPH)